MGSLKKILIFFAAFGVIFVIKEFAELYTYLSVANIYLGYLALFLIVVAIVYFVVIPAVSILKMPVAYDPALSKEQGLKQIPKRIDRFRKNKFLFNNNFNFANVSDDLDGYNQITNFLSEEINAIRSRYVNQLFYSTSISQNGFLDAVLILSASVNMIKEIFILYNGRVSNREVWVIAKKVYYSLVIGGSEGVEYATEEIYSKLATNSMKSIPFLDKIISSVVDGFINASLLTRVALITENYCKLLYIESDKDIYPSSKTIITTTKDITFSIVKNINDTLLQIVKNKSQDILMKGVNPVAVVFKRSYNNVIESNTIKKSKNLFEAGASFVKGIFTQ